MFNLAQREISLWSTCILWGVTLNILSFETNKPSPARKETWSNCQETPPTRTQKTWSQETCILTYLTFGLLIKENGFHLLASWECTFRLSICRGYIKNKRLYNTSVWSIFFLHACWGLIFKLSYYCCSQQATFASYYISS